MNSSIPRDGGSVRTPPSSNHLFGYHILTSTLYPIVPRYRSEATASSFLFGRFHLLCFAAKDTLQERLPMLVGKNREDAYDHSREY